MRIVPHEWKQIEPNKWHPAPGSKLQLQLTSPQAIWVQTVDQDGEIHEVCATFDSAATLSLSDPFNFKFEGKAHGFVHAPKKAAFVHDDEVYTNLDQMPSESGHMAEVTRMLRLHELRQIPLRQEAARQMAILMANRQLPHISERAPDPAPVETPIELPPDDTE